jgi:hypothetical protein
MKSLQVHLPFFASAMLAAGTPLDPTARVALVDVTNTATKATIPTIDNMMVLEQTTSHIQAMCCWECGGTGGIMCCCDYDPATQHCSKNGCEWLSKIEF